METISKASHEWSPAFKFRILSPRKTLSHDNTIFRLSPKFRACEALWERSIPRRSGTTYLFYYPAQTSLGNSLYHASSHRRALVAPCGEKLVPITGKNCDALVICFPFLCVYFFRIFLQESIRRLNSLQYIPNQWISIFAHSDWLLKVGIYPLVCKTQPRARVGGSFRFQLRLKTIPPSGLWREIIDFQVEVMQWQEIKGY